MIQLPQVTLIAVSTTGVVSAQRALEYSCQGIQFGAVKLVSPERPDGCPQYIQHDRIDPFKSIDDWNHYVVYWLWQHFTTDYCLLIHGDSAIIHPNKWQDKFLDYDYIGSPWSHECALAIQGGRDQPYSRVGNSVGIRSRKLCRLPQAKDLSWRRFNADSNEDTFITAHAWEFFAMHGCTKAPLEVAIEFGREEEFPENSHITEPFLFHKWYGKNAQYPRF